MRGSDQNASLYWLARMLEGGEDPLYVARRLVRFASEDIGKWRRVWGGGGVGVGVVRGGVWLFLDEECHVIMQNRQEKKDMS